MHLCVLSMLGMISGADAADLKLDDQPCVLVMAGIGDGLGFCQLLHQLCSLRHGR